MASRKRYPSMFNRLSQLMGIGQQPRSHVTNHCNDITLQYSDAMPHHSRHEWSLQMPNTGAVCCQPNPHVQHAPPNNMLVRYDVAGGCDVRQGHDVRRPFVGECRGHTPNACQSQRFDVLRHCNSALQGRLHFDSRNQIGGVRSGYRPDVTTDLDPDVFPDDESELPYARTVGEGFQSHYVPPVLSAKSRNKLRKANVRLKNRNKKLCLGFCVLVVTMAVSMAILLVKYPSLNTNIQYFLSLPASPSSAQQNSDAESSGGAQKGSCSLVSVVEKCSYFLQSSGNRPCQLDIKTAMCILTETKSDLFNRTRTLDDNVWESKQSLNLSSWVGLTQNISVVYDSRPSAYLQVIPTSHDQNSDGCSGAPCQLVWRTEVAMSPVRDMDFPVTRQDRGRTVYDLRVVKRGYYHVISQVTSDKEDGQQGAAVHWVYRNYGASSAGASSTQRPQLKLLQNGSSSAQPRHLSFVQGVFDFREGETLSVFSNIPDINHKNTFFAVFHIGD